MSNQRVLRSGAPYDIIVKGAAVALDEVEDIRTVHRPADELAAYLGLEPGAFETAARASELFEVLAAKDLGESFPRNTRPGGGGYWPGIRLRQESEVRSVREIMYRRARAADTVRTVLSDGLVLDGARIRVSWDDGRGEWRVTGFTPDEVGAITQGEGAIGAAG